MNGGIGGEDDVVDTEPESEKSCGWIPWCCDSGGVCRIGVEGKEVVGYLVMEGGADGVFD